MIVVGPAVDVGPLDRLELGVGRLQRIDVARVERQRGQESEHNDRG